MVEDNIPSIHCEVLLKNGQKVQLFAVHPTPPVPNENPRSTERDKELLLVADLAKASALPCIVIGDLNDVAWSYTTALFLKMSGLLLSVCNMRLASAEQEGLVPEPEDYKLANEKKQKE